MTSNYHMAHLSLNQSPCHQAPQQNRMNDDDEKEIVLSRHRLEFVTLAALEGMLQTWNLIIQQFKNHIILILKDVAKRGPNIISYISSISPGLFTYGLSIFLISIVSGLIF
jgi:hypothetical protein